jgi:hypothetical protein
MFARHSGLTLAGGASVVAMVIVAISGMAADGAVIKMTAGELRATRGGQECPEGGEFYGCYPWGPSCRCNGHPQNQNCDCSTPYQFCKICDNDYVELQCSGGGVECSPYTVTCGNLLFFYCTTTMTDCAGPGATPTSLRCKDQCYCF